MTIAQFRSACLKVDGAIEGGHMEHPDFRLGGRIFATLGYPNASCAMVKVAPEEQAVLIASEPEVFSPASGAWGRGGSTIVQLAPAKKAPISRALELAADLARSLGPTRSSLKKTPSKKRPTKKSVVKKKSSVKKKSAVKKSSAKRAS